jgi:SNF2 family DNA or RNA helicase
MHKAKLEALEEAVEAAQGQPVIIAYSYKHDLERIQKHLKAYAPRTLDNPSDITDWNEGKIQVLLTHPASAGHGLNLQFGGHHIIWFGLTWSLELYQQLCKRLDRPGQKFPVVITRLVVKGTMDQRVLPALKEKSDQQDLLMEAVKVLIKKYRSDEDSCM